MFQDKYVFAQLASFLNRSKFNRIVTKYDGDKYVKHFTCWNQLLALMFGQLSNRESLRDLIVALEAHHSKCYHLGMGKNVSKSSLARANQDRDYHIFEEYAYYLVSEARQKCANHIFKLGGNVYAFDSTTIDLCLSVFWWAKFRKKKGGIKVHTLYDVETQIPAFFHITEASVHDSKVMIEIPYELTYLDGELMKSYLHDLAIVQEYATLNRKIMIQEICKNMKWKELHSHSCIHNYVDFSSSVPILRKGAISAKEGEPVLIPVNMRDGIILGTGLGNADWNYSAPHGAGRLMSRSKAKELLSMEEYQESMNGIYTTSVSRATIDEAPQAYKSMEEIKNAITDTVEIIDTIKPIYNFKASD